MSLNLCSFNDLGDLEIGVWCRINPELDPGSWAGLCRSIGKLSQREFTAIVALVNAHKCLRNAVKGHILGKLGIEGQGRRDNREIEWRDIPIVSLGPSGIGGEFQREVGGKGGIIPTRCVRRLKRDSSLMYWRITPHMSGILS